MKEHTMILLLFISVVVLILVVIYQKMVLIHNRKQLMQVTDKLKDILDHSKEEKVMLFTDYKPLQFLLLQMNRLLEERQKMKADYIQSEQSFKRMLSNISHDMKTPLTVILGYLEIMRLKDTENKMLLHVEQKAVQVMDLINEFFQLAKLEAGDTSLVMNKVNVSQLCKEVVLDFYQILDSNAFQVEIDIPAKDYFVWGDEDAIKRILSNLISNAIRYGGEGNYLGVLLYKKESFVSIQVKDKGKGILKEHAAYIFERLYTLEDSRNSKIQGNGLGLTIAKNLANQLGGDIVVESIPNEVTIFTVSLKEYEKEERFT